MHIFWLKEGRAFYYKHLTHIRVHTIETLRVRTFFHQIFQGYHVYCNFILGYICRITVNFGTLKDGSLLINIFASNNFLVTGISSKMASTHCQK